ncbi:hypothetical protein N7510_002627 [Penicillium lagena]|uniref:uncharacterized protein n=1 Tax=Penicillium lagena TaxID=94218 RepID=UPI0025400C75|nr:uncharacterized protein N7510_002627 [Penicillium lagena]KAJ5626318.1 hypothetical protein N7510_002627 [Penicillium lagena]
MVLDTKNKYRLQVTAGPEYDPACHTIVPVNQQETVTFENERAVVSLCCSERFIANGILSFNCAGYPEGTPDTHSYFSCPLHKNHQYCVIFSFRLKKTISGDSLIFGNDFDNPIRDRLPPGLNTALRIVRWIIDPGVYGDAYADKPYLYSPALSSLDCLRICGKTGPENWRNALHNEDIEEGGEAGEEVSVRGMNIPPEAHQRKKYFLQRENRQGFDFEPGLIYKAIFANGTDYSLKLPGFTIPVIKYVDDKNHTLRYVLKDRHSGGVIFVLIFRLIFQGHDDLQCNNTTQNANVD